MLFRETKWALQLILVQQAGQRLLHMPCVNPAYFIFNLLNKMCVVFSPLQLLPSQSSYWYHDTGGRMHFIIQMQTHFHSFLLREELQES